MCELQCFCAVQAALSGWTLGLNYNATAVNISSVTSAALQVQNGHTMPSALDLCAACTGSRDS